MACTPADPGYLVPPPPMTGPLHVPSIKRAPLLGRVVLKARVAALFSPMKPCFRHGWDASPLHEACSLIGERSSPMHFAQRPTTLQAGAPDFAAKATGGARP